MLSNLDRSRLIGGQATWEGFSAGGDMIDSQPSSSSSGQLQAGTQRLDELARFRDDWKQEVELHGLAEATYLTSSVPPGDGLQASQNYSTEELPEAQDSFVCH